MRVLILKDAEQNTLLEARPLQETDNIRYEIVEEMLEIENREGYIGNYALDDDGNLVIEYTEIEPTETELLEARLAQMQEEVAMLAEYTMLAMDADDEDI